MVNGYRLYDQSSSPSRSKRFFSSKVSRPALQPTQPPIEWVPGVLNPGVKQQEREAYHSTQSSAEVKNDGAKSLLPICLDGMVLN
jgi:hypothetical protein